MFFPEELDHKIFRLFVQRTLYLMNHQLRLTSQEREIAYLLGEHPEVAVFFSGKHLNISKVYFPSEFNPFLFLAALLQVLRHIRDDHPKGFADLISESFPESWSDAQVRSYLARRYLELYSREKDQLEDFTPESFLDEFRQTFKQFPSRPTESQVESSPDEWTINQPSAQTETALFMKQMLRDFHHAMKEAASQVQVSRSIQLKSALAKLPNEWVTAIASNWLRPPLRLKRDRIEDLWDFFFHENTTPLICTRLSSQEIAALRMIYGAGGQVSYKKLVRHFGDETADGYWWTQQPPKSVIGGLRHKGLIFVFQIVNKNRHYQTALIPGDLLWIVAEVLEMGPKRSA